MDSKLPIQVSAIKCKSREALTSPEYLLVLMLTEGASLQGAGAKELPAGTLLFLSPFSDRKLAFAADARAIYAVLPVSFLEPMIGIPKQVSAIMLQDSADTAREKLIELFDLVYNNDADLLAQTCTAYELLRALKPMITNDVTTQTAPAAANQRASEMKEYVEAHFREQIALGDIAEAFSVSRQYISTAFHRELGISFSDYLSKVRLDEAMRLLMTTDMNVTNISERSGFPNLRSFNTSFREVHGCTPREFRKNRSRADTETTEGPTSTVLRDVNQFLQPYRLVYHKTEAAIRFSDIIKAGPGVEWEPHWDILNVDNAVDCLQSSAQTVLREIQKDMHFRYVRLGNITTNTMIPFLPMVNCHRFTSFIQVIEFFRELGLSPMLALGNNCDVMLNMVIRDDLAYSVSTQEWLALLQELLDTSIRYWGTKWVSTWRFEFYAPEALYDTKEDGDFMELFRKSERMIHEILPAAQVGGPALSVDSTSISHWNDWFAGVAEQNIQVDFISAEVWADHTINVNRFEGQYGVQKTSQTTEKLNNADASLAIQRTRELKTIMRDYGYENIPLYISALGITKHNATFAQIGGHCAAYLVKCNLELNDLVQGIGCWKALNYEEEYANEYRIIGYGCGLTSRFDLKNINWYAQSFLTGLMPYRLFWGSNYVVTTDRDRSYAILIHNCKNYSAYFYKHYLEWDHMINFSDGRYYESNTALEQTISISGATDGDYWADQYLIGDHHGCLAAVLQQIGEIRVVGEKESLYLAGQSMPYRNRFRITSDGGLRFSVTLQPNEVMLLRIFPE